MKRCWIAVQNRIFTLLFSTLFLLPVMPQNVSAASIRPVCLRCEYLTSPINIDTPKPRFSWKLESDGCGIRQTAYHIQVQNVDSGKTIWDSGEVASDRQLWIE